MIHIMCIQPTDDRELAKLMNAFSMQGSGNLAPSRDASPDRERGRSEEEGVRWSPGVLLAALMLGACQVRVPVATRPEPPAYLRFPENEVAQGVGSFRDSVGKGGMVQVARDLRKCQGTMAPGAPADLVRQCFAFETAAFNVAMAHDARLRTPPLPGLSRAEFSRRLDGYCARLGVTGRDCPAARTSMSEQVNYRLGT